MTFGYNSQNFALKKCRWQKEMKDSRRLVILLHIPDKAVWQTLNSTRIRGSEKDAFFELNNRAE
jgi:hypothetical protein